MPSVVCIFRVLCQYLRHALYAWSLIARRSDGSLCLARLPCCEEPRNPVPVMPLVEVIRGLRTDDGTLDTTLQLCRAMKKELQLI